jgi:hypothetical protein
MAAEKLTLDQVKSDAKQELMIVKMLEAEIRSEDACQA